MDSKKHGGRGRKGGKARKKKQRLLLQQRTYDDSMTKAAMEKEYWAPVT